jgi:hypothetical protein
MTRATIEANRDAAKTAYESALAAQSYTVNMGGTSRSKTNHDIQKLLEIYEYWENRLDRYDSNSRRVKFGTARI